jgi:two-component system, response regulator
MNIREVSILLVEDNMDDAELTIRSLKKHNFANKLFHVKDGAEALDFLYRRGAYHQLGVESKPRVILLDLKMPKVSGLEVLREIKSTPETSDIPVVALTSSREDSDIRECYELGVNSYIVKPVDFSNFAQAVADVGFYWAVLNQLPGGK